MYLFRFCMWSAILPSMCLPLLIFLDYFFNNKPKYKVTEIACVESSSFSSSVISISIISCVIIHQYVYTYDSLLRQYFCYFLSFSFSRMIILSIVNFTLGNLIHSYTNTYRSKLHSLSYFYGMFFFYSFFFIFYF